jgi:Arc/MetJ-type ribon-helix-helix transcriptional regulator
VNTKNRKIMGKTMNISIGEEMLAFIHQRVAADLHGSVSDYIRCLVRRDQCRWTERIGKPRQANEWFISLEDAKAIVEMHGGRVS